MNRLFVSLLAILPFMLSAQASDTTTTLQLKNPLSVERHDVPVTIPVAPDVHCAVVTVNGVEIPCQLDDLNDDAIYDELSFVTNMKKKEIQTVSIVFSTEGSPRQYEPRTYGSLSLRDRSAKNPKHLPVRSFTVPKESNSYQYIFPHGPLLESELVGFRIYADHRQSVDYYGHRNKQLELHETAFYPTPQQKTTTYGDDVLYTGNTYGCGTLHGWNGTTSVMYENARTRTFSVIAQGPVRTIVETINRGWQVTPESKPVDVTTRYILYAGHRDVEVDVHFSRPVPDLQLSTGVVDIVGSEELTDKAGLRGCWGTALAGKNTEVYDVHTCGLMVCVPEEYYRGDAYFTDGKSELPNQAYVALVGTETDHLRYWFAATCDMETFGFADSKAWMEWAKAWKVSLRSPLRPQH